MNKMKKKVLMMTMAAVTLSAVAQQPVDYVNPIIGTNGMGLINVWGKLETKQSSLLYKFKRLCCNN